MDLKQFEANAVAGPPSAPAAPSVGFPTNKQTPVPATTPGEYWYYQVLEEFRHLIEDIAGITPDHEDLTQLGQAIVSIAGGSTLQALDFPTIDTADNRLTLTPATAVAGGTVSVPADVLITLGEELTAGETGRLRSFKTVAWQSDDLAANETHYIRAQVINGALTFYDQIGADSDAKPGTLKGTPDAGAGGGFDSTVIDMLVAKVVTGNAGTMPTVTSLANAKRLEVMMELTPDSLSNPSTNGAQFNYSYSLNWARLPIALPVMKSYYVDATGITDYDNFITILTGDRYGGTFSHVVDHSNGGGLINLHSFI